MSRVGSEPRQVPAELSSLVKECEAIGDHLSFRIAPIAQNVVMLTIRISCEKYGAETTAMEHSGALHSIRVINLFT